MLLFSVSIVRAGCCWIPLLCQPCTPLVLLYRSGSMSLVDPLHTAVSTSQTFINLLFNSVSDPLNTNQQKYEPHQHHSPLGLILHLYLCSTSYEPLQAGQLYLYSSWYQTIQDPLPQCSSELLLRFQYCFLMIKILELHS